MTTRETFYYCPHCGARNITTIDLTAGSVQTYVEDCEACCRPIALHIRHDQESDDVMLMAEPES